MKADMNEPSHNRSNIISNKFSVNVMTRVIMQNPHKQGNCTFGGNFVRTTENPYKQLDRARRVVLGTTLEHVDHVVRRIRGGYISREPHWGGYSGPFGYFS